MLSSQQGKKLGTVKFSSEIKLPDKSRLCSVKDRVTTQMFPLKTFFIQNNSLFSFDEKLCCNSYSALFE